MFWQDEEILFGSKADRAAEKAFVLTAVAREWMNERNFFTSYRLAADGLCELEQSHGDKLHFLPQDFQAVGDSVYRQLATVGNAFRFDDATMSEDALIARRCLRFARSDPRER